jgi:MYXO-CTERM domain-containing protein
VDDYVDYFHCESLPGFANGQACTGADSCQSGSCVDGRCCATACTGACEQCNKPGSEGQCVAVAAGTDPREKCRAATGGHLSCNGTCNGSGQCTFPGVTTKCELCTACDGAGVCRMGMTDDSACGVIECSGLDRECRVYDDLSSDRCQGIGVCKSPNVEAACTSWRDTCAADGGAGGDGGAGRGDGGTGSETDGGGGGGGGSGCGCVASGGPGGGVLGALLVAVAVARRRRSRQRRP